MVKLPGLDKRVRGIKAHLEGQTSYITIIIDSRHDTDGSGVWLFLTCDKCEEAVSCIVKRLLLW